MTFTNGQRVTIGQHGFRTGTVLSLQRETPGGRVYLVWTAGIVAEVEERDMKPMEEQA